MGHIISGRREAEGLGISMTDLERWKAKIEEKLGTKIDIQGKVEAKVLDVYLERIKTVRPWVRAQGKYVGCEIAKGFEEGIPSLRFGESGVRQCRKPPTKKPKKQSNAERLGMAMAAPLLMDFQQGIEAGAKTAITARLLPYFIILPVAGFFLGKWIGGRK